jgi:hypothetical protein
VATWGGDVDTVIVIEKDFPATKTTNSVDSPGESGVEKKTQAN